MQLILKFKFEKEQDWNFDQHILQWIFYSPLNKSLHKSKFWLFCLSNIYPYEPNKNYNPNTIYQIQVKSIRKDIITQLFEHFSLHNNIKFWENKIKIKKVFIKNPDPIYSWKIIKTITPIVLSVNEKLAKEYNIPYERNGKPLYFNKNMPLWLFKYLLNKNILSKYIFILKNLVSNKESLENISYKIKGMFYKLEPWEKQLIQLDEKEIIKLAEDITFFNGYRIKGQALVPYKNWKIATTKWELKVWTPEKIDTIKILNTVSLMWLGEKTTAWFGFIN